MALVPLIELTDENGNNIYLNIEEIVALVRVPIPDEWDEETDGEWQEQTRVILKGGIPAAVFGTPEDIVAIFRTDEGDDAVEE